MEIHRTDAGSVRASRQVRRGSVIDEVDEPLRRGHESAASRDERRVLERPLEGDPGEHALGPIWRQVVRPHLDHDARVGEAEPAAGWRPTVDDNLVAGRRRRTDHPARAHAEGEDPAPVDLVDQRV